ncbi:MAG: hypothetical protein GTN89_06765, partial [Acidobacteria bacterium]|nr:hypothetical protein [Acidobacteriota bacterium]NIM60863.1 hypothetical protein [Acidobacteriota bacterium]NIO59018.1 hypothetical protein [Acidobacteriota bacterium]NIQ30063.1 hypothetical protein [Acidobacteriota bacterium]NIQ84850.1 hypothetical protein [Acidobacteriota bacterium]
GREPDAVADPPTGFGLAATLRESVAADDRLLIVRPDRGRADLEEGLVELGAEVRAVPFYRNRPAGNLSAVVSAVERGDFDAAVFGSPSSFVHLFGAAGERAVGIFSGLALVAIGPTTAEAIRDLGCAVAAVAVEPTDEGIANAVEAALGR